MRLRYLAGYPPAVLAYLGALFAECRLAKVVRPLPESPRGPQLTE